MMAPMSEVRMHDIAELRTAQMIYEMPLPITEIINRNFRIMEKY